MNRIAYLFQLLRAFLLYSWRFKKFGNKVTFGYLNRIKGARFISIGDNSTFGNSLRLEAVSQYGGGRFEPKIIIGKGVAINQNFHCTCAESVIIGDGTSVTANCGIFDIIHPYDDITINPRTAKIKTSPVKIGKDCLIGMNSVILPGATIGNHCVIGANSTVSGAFPDYCVIAGSPAKIIKKYNFETKEWIKVQ